MRRRRPTRGVTVYSIYNARAGPDGNDQEASVGDTLPEWTKLVDALEEHDEDEIEGSCDDINTLLTFVRFVCPVSA